MANKTMNLKVVEAELTGRCFCGCNGETSGYWLPGHDHRALAAVVKACAGENGNGTANLIASLGMAPKRRGRKPAGAK